MDSILDRHAPVKIFQVRKNYTPYLSEETKQLMAARKNWKEVATKFGYKSAEKISKDLSKEIRKHVVNDEKEYFKKNFGDKTDTSN